jgi:hypothetical protein
MRRLTYTALCVALVLAVTGAVAARYFLRPSFGCSDRLGLVWHIAGDFHGRIDILDARGDLGGIVVNGFGEMKEAVVVTTDGEAFTLQGPGRHAIRGRDGTLFGYAVFRSVTEKEYLATRGLTRMPTLHEELDRQARDWSGMNWDTHGGVSGMESAPWGIRGFDTAIGLRWRMLGSGELKVVDGAGRKVLASGRSAAATGQLPAAVRRYADGAEPDLVVMFGKRVWKISGYGVHKLRDSAGRIQVIIEALPR